MTDLLDTTCMGVIQIDRRGQIVEANDTAKELLRRNDGLDDDGGTLHAAWPEDDLTLQKLLAEALPRLGGQGASGSMAVRRREWSPRLALHVKPVTYCEEDYRVQRVTALVLIVDPESRARIEPAFVKAVLGLTSAEATIAVLLAEGRTAQEIATATGREYSTVRTHLNHMFAKLGYSRQFELARAVLALTNLPVSRR